MKHEEPIENLKYVDINQQESGHVRFGSRLVVNTLNPCVVQNGVEVKVVQIYLTDPKELSGFDVETPEGKRVFMRYSRLRRINA